MQTLNSDQIGSQARSLRGQLTIYNSWHKETIYFLLARDMRV